MWIVSKPKTWSCTQLASCSSLQWVLVPTMKKCINLYSKCPCQLINHFITRCPLHLVQVHRMIFRNPTTAHGKSSCSVSPNFGEEIDTDASGFISPDEILEHTSNPAVWLGFGSLVKGFFLGSFLGSFFFWEPQKKGWEVLTHRKKSGRNHRGLFVIGNFWKKFYWTKRFGFTNKNQEKTKRTTEAAMIWGGLDGGLEKYIEFLTGLVLWLLFYLRKKLHPKSRKSKIADWKVYMGVSKNRGKTPKMDGLNNGKPD